MAPAEPPPGAFEPAPPRVAGAKPAEAAPGRRRITRQDLSPQSLRKLILLREILDPPVSLRDEEVWQRM